MTRTQIEKFLVYLAPPEVIAFFPFMNGFNLEKLQMIKAAQQKFA